jgi:hypothetical protein
MLNQLLQTLGVTVPVYDLRITEIPTVSKLQIAGIEVPFFGELLTTELDAYKQIITCKKDIIERFSQLMANSGCSMSYSVDQFLLAFKTGNIKKNNYEIDDTSWELLGSDDLKELAESLGVEEFISTDEKLQEIITENFSSWFAAGIEGNSGIEKANNVLKKIPVIRETEVRYEFIDPQELLNSVNLSWDHVSLIADLKDPYFIYRVLIFLRTGRGDFNPFSYSLLRERTEIAKALDDEISGLVSPSEPIHVNENIETDQGGNEIGEQTTEGQSEEISVPPPTRRRKN